MLQTNFPFVRLDINLANIAFTPAVVNSYSESIKIFTFLSSTILLHTARSVAFAFVKKKS